MIVISIGMQKSGSGYLYNILNELEIQANNVDARMIKTKYGLNMLMKWHNNNIGKLSLISLIRLWRISLREGTFVVKTHQGPTLASKIMCRLGMVRIIYLYRDPRDVTLSVIDHGRRIIAGGGNTTFAKMVEFDSALSNVVRWLRIWKKCDEMSGVLMVKYEELIEAPIKVIKRIEEYLGIAIEEKARNDILWKYSRENLEGDRAGLHFNKAIPYRYRTEMSQEQKKRCLDKFGDYLRTMGYSLE